MTALDDYARLEAPGLWRASADAQRQDVVVSLGDASLTISDFRDCPLAHWSLAAVARANPGEMPALFHPEGDPHENLELGEIASDMVEAIERVRQAVARRRPQPGRLRVAGGTLLAVAIAVVAAVWLPGALRDHALRVLPQAKRTELSDALMNEVHDLTGRTCETPEGRTALAALAERVLGPDPRARLVVLRDGPVATASLPDGRILLDRAIVEDPAEPEVTAGFILAESCAAGGHGSHGAASARGGVGASLRVLTTGELSPALLRRYGERLLTEPPPPVDAETLLADFEAAGLSTRPYAYARDITGETVLSLIEADPFAKGTTAAVLSDADWIRLQNICEE